MIQRKTPHDSRIVILYLLIPYEGGRKASSNGLGHIIIMAAITSYGKTIENNYPPPPPSKYQIRKAKLMNVSFSYAPLIKYKITRQINVIYLF